MDVIRRHDMRRWRAWNTSAGVSKAPRRSPGSFTSSTWRWGGEGQRAREGRGGQGGGKADSQVEGSKGRTQGQDGGDP